MRKLIGPAVFLIAASLSAQPIEINLRTLKDPLATRNDLLFQLAGTFGFSVDQALGNYYLFQTVNHHRKGWIPAVPPATSADMYDSMFTGSSCSAAGPFPLANPKCGDAAGVVWKQPNSTVTRWNYMNSVTGTTAPMGQVPTPTTWPGVWTATGASGYATTLDAAKINAAFSGGGAVPSPEPPQGCSRDDKNSQYFATSAANTKVAYVNGTWYMAFNEGINNPAVSNTTPPSYSWSQDDLFRVGWATSTDGRNWTIRHILFRTALESKYCGGGLLLTQLLVDGGYFYMVLNEIGYVGSQSDTRILLLRAPIDANPANVDGYGTWQIATNHPTDPTHYLWVNTPTGGLLNTSTTGSNPLNAYPIMPSAGYLRQAALARVFTSSAANSPSRLIGVAVQEVTYGTQTLQLWSAPNLDTPFALESAVDTANIYAKGDFGWEFGFTQHPDNTAATPRLVGTEFDFWLNANLQGSYNPDGQTHKVTLYRTTATMSGGIFSPRGSLRTASGANYVSSSGTAISATATANGPNEHWVIVDANGGSLASGDTVYLIARNGLYLTNSGGSVLTAAQVSPSTNETFVIEKKNGTGTIVNGDLVALRSPATTKYIIAAGGGGSTVTNNGLDTNPYTRFVYLAN